MLVVVNGTDITDYIDKKSYKMNAEDPYESWLDGNYKEHRIYTRSKIRGSFTVTLYGQDNMDTSAFLQLWNGAVSNKVLTALVYVQNTDSNEAIEAYYSFQGTFHREMVNGLFCDKLSVTITER